MTIPLDRLYHFIENLAEEIYKNPIIIYRFNPHGSKNLVDLKPLVGTRSYVDSIIQPKILCLDQEITDLKYYNTNVSPIFPNMIKIGEINISHFDLCTFSVFEKYLLLHSEKNLKKFLDRSILVYYWSHAIIARDWFRYAEHENFCKNSKKIFLIYNRAWSNTREYRLKFTDLLIDNKLISHCQTTFNSIDPESNTHYNNHKFVDQHWKPKNVLENFLQPTNACSSSSADFVTDDYNSTDIEVILETIFDHPNLHLTEKTLRAIACGQPFILASATGSLEYLRSYGFKTFDSVWSENYDQIQDPKLRLESIISLMKEIANWDKETLTAKLEQARDIANFNKKWFFSKEFSNLIINELKTNLQIGFDTLINDPKNYICFLNKFEEKRDLLESSELHDVFSEEDLGYIINYTKEKIKENNL